jgi:plastocyanin
MLKAGKYTFVIKDRATIHDFHLVGPGVSKKTSVEKVQTATWTLRLRKGTYKFFCDVHSSLNGRFKVT